jgi:hypothetical protein
MHAPYCRTDVSAKWRRVVGYSTYVYIFGILYPRWFGGGNAVLGYDRTLISLSCFSIAYELTQDWFGSYDPFKPYFDLGWNTFLIFVRSFNLGSDSLRAKLLK